MHHPPNSSPPNAEAKTRTDPVTAGQANLHPQTLGYDSYVFLKVLGDSAFARLTRMNRQSCLKYSNPCLSICVTISSDRITST